MCVLEVSIGVLEVSIGVLEVSLCVLEVSIGVLEVSIGVLEVSIGVLEVSIDVLEVSIDVLEVSISVLEVSKGVLGVSLGVWEVWIDGGTQIFFSYAIALGGMIGLGSYNKFNNNFYRDCTIIACINSGTSVLGGFVVFSVLGFMAKLKNVDIDQVADKGPGLAFITYPKAVSEMPLPQLWAVLFFVMIFTVGLDSQFVGVESFVTHFIDIFPRYLYKRSGRMIFTGVYCAVSYIVGLTMVTKGGMYVFQLFDYYAASGMVLLWISFWEAIVIGWIFEKTGKTGCSGISEQGIFVFHIVEFSPLKYNLSYEYPGWAQGLGIVLALLSMVCVPVVVVKVFLTSKGSPNEVIFL
ncbi:hypothetical protein FSP39_005526 [Pinctada imbricata]|uniref:Uncharacterized protein n=1 Tax=Pinctada imbricata TaxID=66713 RepID=A0AA88XKP1_PINIB|nr:hypothetical protein FSP39_005526 [Pinctada imbricata]